MEFCHDSGLEAVNLVLDPAPDLVLRFLKLFPVKTLDDRRGEMNGAVIAGKKQDFLAWSLG